MTQTTLWQSTFRSPSLRCATGDLERIVSPNLRLMAENVDSTLDRCGRSKKTWFGCALPAIRNARLRTQRCARALNSRRGSASLPYGQPEPCLSRNKGSLGSMRIWHRLAAERPIQSFVGESTPLLLRLLSRCHADLRDSGSPPFCAARVDGSSTLGSARVDRSTGSFRWAVEPDEGAWQRPFIFSSSFL